MIINDKHKFAFIHIPKCAGTTIRMSLEKYDSSKGKYSHANGFDPSVGRIDMGHIPLARLRELFPDDYEKVCGYNSFAVVRDPFRRFPSSLYQHLAMYSEKPVRTMTREDFISALEKIIRYLEVRDTFLDYQFIHFQKQTDYIYDLGEKVVGNIYTPQTLDHMFADIGGLFGEKIILHKQAGEGLIYREGAYATVASIINKIYAGCLKGIAPESLVKYAKQKFMQKPANAYADVFGSNEVKDFIRDYYKEDLELVDNLTSNHGHES